MLERGEAVLVEMLLRAIDSEEPNREIRRCQFCIYCGFFVSGIWHFYES